MKEIKRLAGFYQSLSGRAFPGTWWQDSAGYTYQVTELDGDWISFRSERLSGTFHMKAGCFIESYENFILCRQKTGS